MESTFASSLVKSWLDVVLGLKTPQNSSMDVMGLFQNRKLLAPPDTTPYKIFVPETIFQKHRILIMACPRMKVQRCRGQWSLTQI
jgi:hypothetical protein